jgi:RNA polymerase sigma-70 factor, ECF subfamily
MAWVTPALKLRLAINLLMFRVRNIVRLLKPPDWAVASESVYGNTERRSPTPGIRKRVARTRVDYENTPEGALVRRAQSGDESAFREIVERYQSKVFSIIHGIVRQRNDVEDIAQQVFAKVYFSIRNFDFRSSLITWIYKITVNECFDYLRKKKVRKLVYESDMSEDEVRRVENSEPALDRGARRYVAGAPRLRGQAHGRVSDEEKQLLLLKEVEGYSVEELSGMLKHEREYN